ncbi:transcriptional repressor [Candidatus Woesebacteria bacterium]|nr:transcriptional repressor [Candidatus Woesebacteria bacterium]
MHTISTLRKQGFRMTNARKAILFMFDQNSMPLSALDIIAFLKQSNQEVNKSTVYREINFLIKKHILKQLFLAGGVAYYEPADRNHHHHVVCNSCGKIEGVSLNKEKMLISEAQKRSSYKIEDHSLTFYGACKQCQ